MIRLILGAIAIVFLILISIPKKDSFKLNKYHCLKVKQSSYSGIIIYSKINHLNRDVFEFAVKGKDNKIDTIYNLCILNPEAYIELGDSIKKIKDEFTFIVYKNETGEKL